MQSGIRRLGLEPTPARIEALDSYLTLLQKWNRSFNLSGVKDLPRMVERHILDSLAVLPYLHGSTVLDIGSGAGLPGIPLAIFNPEREFILLDSNGKKTRFLFQVKLALKLTNVTVENKRVEDYQCPGQIDIVISRAFASLGRLVQLSRAVTGGHGVLLAMKGNYPDQEIAELPAGFNVSRAIELKVPGVDESRYLIEVPLKEIALKKVPIQDGDQPG
ncbi:MAG: 16S rRNA (guanine(527)-N(7))-methyltransferase RsmG [Gammaproteobacteria bacterium]|nr:16S rRNA (guanine(527)-N(7))-methyltransferase RsmG [Pseudomonadales bacterium]